MGMCDDECVDLVTNVENFWDCAMLVSETYKVYDEEDWYE